MSAQSKMSVERIKKENNIRYHKTWNTGLSNKMGVFDLFFANSKQYKALSQFNRVLQYVQKDKMLRFFRDEKGLIDDALLKEFFTLADQFYSLFGSQSDEGERSFSYRDLMVPSPPDPKDDRVFIQRSVPIIYSWARRPIDYVCKKIGFVYSESMQMQTPTGLVTVTKEKPMFTWQDQDVKSGATKSNCVPYAYYQQQKMKVINLLMDLVSELETLIARYLHQEGFSYNTKERIGSTKDDDWVESGDDEEIDVDEEDEGANDE